MVFWVLQQWKKIRCYSIIKIWWMIHTAQTIISSPSENIRQRRKYNLSLDFQPLLNYNRRSYGWKTCTKFFFNLNGNLSLILFIEQNWEIFHVTSYRKEISLIDVSQIINRLLFNTRYCCLNTITRHLENYSQEIRHRCSIISQDIIHS